MAKYVRIEIPVKKPDDTVVLCDAIVGKNTAEGANSTLKPVIDMAAFALKVTDAKSKP